MRVLCLLCLLLTALALPAQQPMTSAEALTRIHRLEQNPDATWAPAAADSLFQWLESSPDITIFIASGEMNRILKSKFPAARTLLILYMCGMARYDLQHPETDKETQEVDLPAGRQCFCDAYALTRSRHPDWKKDRYFDKICRKQDSAR